MKYRKYAFNIEDPRNGKTSSPELKNIPRTVEIKKKVKNDNSVFWGTFCMTGTYCRKLKTLPMFYFMFVFHRKSSWDDSIPCLSRKIWYSIQKPIRIVVYRF